MLYAYIGHQTDINSRLGCASVCSHKEGETPGDAVCYTPATIGVPKVVPLNNVSTKHLSGAAASEGRLFSFNTPLLQHSSLRTAVRQQHCNFIA